MGVIQWFQENIVSNTLMMVVLIAVIGYLVGSIRICGLELGTAGILLVALVGPVVEELFFRGGILRVLLRTCRRPWVAIVVSGLIFGIVHMNPAQVVFASLAGMLLGWLYWRTRSLIPCMVVHVLNNSFSVWSSLAYPEANSLADVMERPAYLWCLVVAAYLFIMAVVSLHRYKTEQTYLYNQ